mmetsp:Transcript_15504/g.41572  ORF Transcript_15504/g.41572 Transcript_15504/m.41572 type:complete len:326 (-) Transcript_15504:6-983(-)
MCVCGILCSPVAAGAPAHRRIRSLKPLPAPGAVACTHWLTTAPLPGAAPMIVHLCVVVGVVLIAGPQREVVTQELHNEGGVLVRLLVKRVEFCDGVVEGALSEAASVLRLALHLIHEHGVVEGEAKANGVGGRELGECHLLRHVVGLLGLSGDLALGLLVHAELGEVTVVVALHLEVENLGLSGGGLADKVVVEEREDLVADFVELSLNGLTVVLDDLELHGIGVLGALLGLDGGDDAEGRAPGANDVLVGYREQVALLEREVGVRHFRELLHVLHHLLVALGLLSELGHVHSVGLRGGHGLCGRRVAQGSRTGGCWLLCSPVQL